MQKRRFLLGLPGISSIALLLLGAADPAALPPPRLERIADGVWIHQSHADVRGFGAILSQGLVIRGTRGAVLVDTAWTDPDTEQLLGLIQREAGARVRTLIVTHAHADKMGGIGAATRAGVHSYAHALTNLDAPQRGLVAATDAISLAAGEVTSLDGLEVFYPGAGHTRDNVVVYFARARVLFGGCLIRPAGAKDLGNTADADLGHWAAAVRAVAARTLACLASANGYALAAIDAAWRELTSRALQLGIAEPFDAYGLPLDSPQLTLPELCRYYACVACPPELELAPPLFRSEIPAGRYAVFPYAGAASRVEDVYRAIYSVWLPRSSLRPDDFTPINHYVKGGPVRGQIEMEIWIKVRARG